MIPAANVYRALDLYWWIPFDALPAIMNIETIFGSLIGDWPESQPPRKGIKRKRDEVD